MIKTPSKDPYVSGEHILFDTANGAVQTPVFQCSLPTLTKASQTRAPRRRHRVFQDYLCKSHAQYYMSPD